MIRKVIIDNIRRSNTLFRPISQNEIFTAKSILNFQDQYMYLVAIVINCLLIASITSQRILIPNEPNDILISPKKGNKGMALRI